jgi:hypothetical protein
MKKFIALLLAAVLIVSMIGVVTALAGCNIDGKTKVYAGSTYKYTGSATYTGADLVGRLSGLGQDASFNKDSGGAGNKSLSGSCSISVKIPADAAPGKTYTLTFSGQYSTVDAAGNPSDNYFDTSKTITVVEKTASTSTNNHEDDAPATPTPEPTGWALAAIDVPSLAQGGTYGITVTDDPTVPASVLASLKEKQGVLNVDFGSYTCTIDGALLGTIPEGLAGIDLGLTMEKDAALTAAAGGADVYQLHFNHSGALPGSFTYRFKAESNSPGDIVYLYYYYGESGVIEGKQECVVDAEGYITLNIYHCSSYFISNTLIEGAAGILTQPEPSPSPTASPTATPSPTALPEKPVNQNDGLAVSASGPVAQWFGIPYAPLIAALAAAALLSMLLTMMFTRSGLFKRRPRAAADGLFAAETFNAPSEPDKDEPPDDDLE